MLAAHLRAQNIRLAAYLDDWFVVNQNKQMLIEDREKTLNLLINLSFIVNLEKSNLIPTQTITYIGAMFCLKEGIVRPTSERITTLLLGIENILKKESQATARDFLHLLVIIASCIELIPNAKLLHLLFHWKPSRQILDTKVPFSKHLKSHLKWWLNQENLNKGRSITPWNTSITLTTDASKSGYGGSPKQKRDFSRYLVQKRESTSHKGIRNGSSDAINTTFPSKISRQKCSDTLGQFNCCKIHKQTRGYTLSSVVHENLETMAIGIRQSDVAESSTHCREKEHFSRPSKQDQGPTNRVDAEQKDSPKAVHNLGSSSHTCRSVCISNKSSDTDLLLMESRPSSLF